MVVDGGEELLEEDGGWDGGCPCYAGHSASRRSSLGSIAVLTQSRWVKVLSQVTKG